jgi:Fe-S oxidoreductase
MDIKEIVKTTKAYYCLDCGICTASCPVSRVKKDFSPRLTVEKALFDLDNEIIGDKDLWSCLTCGQCSLRCPSKVDYQNFVRIARNNANDSKMIGVATHNGIIQAMIQIQTQGRPLNRRQWLPEDVSTQPEKGEYFYFVGCLPFFQIIYSDIEVPALSIGLDTIKILNRLGISPVVSNAERDCGHDPYWSGDSESFNKLAQLNLEAIRQSGAKKVLFSCAECYYTIKVEYPKYFGPLWFETQHIAEFIWEKIQVGELKLNTLPKKVTYQDPCRLGRGLDVLEEPREVLKSIPELELVEMERNRLDAWCCGSSQWINCTSYTKRMQQERLKDAGLTGADTLITACPKCRIHLSCTLRDPDNKLNLQISDLVNIVAEAMDQRGGSWDG